jgi:hypothetical protein
MVNTPLTINFVTLLVMAIVCTLLLLYSLSLQKIFLTYFFTIAGWLLIGVFAFRLKASFLTQMFLLLPLFIVSLIAILVNVKTVPTFSPTVFIIGLLSFYAARFMKFKGNKKAAQI